MRFYKAVKRYEPDQFYKLECSFGSKMGNLVISPRIVSRYTITYALHDKPFFEYNLIFYEGPPRKSRIKDSIVGRNVCLLYF